MVYNLDNRIMQYNGVSMLSGKIVSTSEMIILGQDVPVRVKLLVEKKWMYCSGEQFPDTS